MISDHARNLYEEVFPDCYFGRNYCIGYTTGSYDKSVNGGKEYVMPYDETEESFIDRIERSKQAGRNLFFEEWEEAKPYDTSPGMRY